MTGRRCPILVLGVGNMLLRDDGVGVEVVRRLERPPAGPEPALPPDTRIADGGTLGLSLLPLIAESRALVVVDAMDAGLAPGEVAVLRGQAFHRACAGGPGPGPGELLAAAAAAGILPPEVSLIGIQPGRIGPGLGLTPPVAGALPAALRATAAEAWRIARRGRAEDRPRAAATGPREVAA